MIYLISTKYQQINYAAELIGKETEMEIGPFLAKNKPCHFYDYVRYRLYEIDSIIKKLSGNESGAERKKHCLYLKEEYEKLLEDENG